MLEIELLKLKSVKMIDEMKNKFASSDLVQINWINGKRIPNPDYVIAVAIARQARIINTDAGAIKVPGVDIDKLFPEVNTLMPRIVDGKEYTPIIGETEIGTGKQIYLSPDGKKVTLD